MRQNRVPAVLTNPFSFPMERFLKSKLKNGCFSGVSPTRSRIMSSIRGKSNKSTESALRFALVRAGISGWRLHACDLPGCPDFFFSQYRIAIFVDGCFWHGCPKCGHTPRTRTAFWKAKLQRNRERDIKVNRKLRRQSIRVVRFWEHIFKDASNVKQEVMRLQSMIAERQRKTAPTIHP